MRRGLFRCLPWLPLVGLAVLLMVPAARAQPTVEKTEKGPAKKKEAKGLNVTDALTPDLPTDKHRPPGCYYRIHPYRMEEGATYTIDLMTGQFDAWLRSVDSAGNTLAE